MPIKPTGYEQNFIAKMEFDRRKAIEEEKRKKMEVDERNKLQKLHYMKCPKCGMELIEIDYKNIKVDKCSDCSGIWLDAGELEAIAKLDKSLLDNVFSVFKR